jgi:hypothetical protein
MIDFYLWLNAASYMLIAAGLVNMQESCRHKGRLTLQGSTCYKNISLLCLNRHGGQMVDSIVRYRRFLFLCHNIENGFTIELSI